MARSSAMRISGLPFAVPGLSYRSGSSTVSTRARRRLSERTALSTRFTVMRRSHPATSPSPRNDSSFRQARTNTSCVSSAARPESPVMRRQSA